MKNQLTQALDPAIGLHFEGSNATASNRPLHNNNKNNMNNNIIFNHFKREKTRKHMYSVFKPKAFQILSTKTSTSFGLILNSSSNNNTNNKTMATALPFLRRQRVGRSQINCSSTATRRLFFSWLPIES
mmetsp:Transcript_19335/g.41674  ORF Transcript_19335/g.41674 Transcript_19335/m.41674 type:complete len:129 (-) Transcript_19335:161-547(-)